MISSKILCGFDFRENHGRTVIEHPLLAPRLEELYEKAREQNPKLPKVYKDFADQTHEGSGEKSFISKGHVKWRAALSHGLTQLRANARLRSARRKDKERMKEISGAWILEGPPWWTHFQRQTWRISMRFRYGLLVTLPLGNMLVQRCLAKKQSRIALSA